MTLAATIAAAATPNEATPGPRGTSSARLPGRLDCGVSWAADVAAAGIEPGSVSRPRRDAAPAAASVASPDVRSAPDVGFAGSKRPWAQRCAAARRNLAAAGETLRRLDGRLRSLDLAVFLRRLAWTRAVRVTVLCPRSTVTEPATVAARPRPMPATRRTRRGLPAAARNFPRFFGKIPPLSQPAADAAAAQPQFTVSAGSGDSGCPETCWRLMPRTPVPAHAHGVLDDATTVGARITVTPRFHGAWRTS